MENDIRLDMAKQKLIELHHTHTEMVQNQLKQLQTLMAEPIDCALYFENSDYERILEILATSLDFDKYINRA